MSGRRPASLARTSSLRPLHLTNPGESGHDKAVRILFFAQLKDATNCDSVEIGFSSSVTADELWTELLKKFPGLAGHRSSVRLSRNFEYTSAATRFSNADEVALIPPVSGG